MKYTYPAVFEPYEDGGIGLWFPDLPRGISKGNDYDDAVDMAQEALGLILDSYDKDHLPYPVPGLVKESLEPGMFIVDITVEK